MSAADWSADLWRPENAAALLAFLREFRDPRDAEQCLRLHLAIAYEHGKSDGLDIARQIYREECT